MMATSDLDLVRLDLGVVMRRGAGRTWVGILAGGAGAVAWWGCSTTRSEAPVASGSSAQQPPWWQDARTLADQGCTCGDEPCLTRTRAALVALEDQHGGMDEAPPEVHEAHARFDACYRNGTFDLVRDLEHAKNALCGCGDAGCAKLALAEVTHARDKYKGVVPDPQAVEPVAKLTAALDACLAEKVVDGPAWADELSSIAKQVCACKDQDCVNGATGRVLARLRGVLIVQNDAGSEQRINDAYERMCKCGVATVVEGLLPGATATVNCRVKSQ